MDFKVNKNYFIKNRTEVRNNALGFLQKALLSPKALSTLNVGGFYLAFSEVLFPLMKDLQNSAIYKQKISNERVLEEIRARASGLLSKVFLQYLQSLTQDPHRFISLWMEILSYMEAFMKTSESLSESLMQSIKNILFVMTALDIFKPGAMIDGQDIWTLTWEKLAFCPTLKTEFDLDNNNTNSSSNNTNTSSNNISTTTNISTITNTTTVSNQNASPSPQDQQN